MAFNLLLESSNFKLKFEETIVTVHKFERELIAQAFFFFLLFFFSSSRFTINLPVARVMQTREQQEEKEDEKEEESSTSGKKRISLLPKLKLRMNTITLIAQRLRSNRSSEIQYPSSESNNLFAH